MNDFWFWFLCPSRSCVTDSDTSRITLSCNWRLEHYKWRCWVWTMFMVQGSKISLLSSRSNWWMWCKDIHCSEWCKENQGHVRHVCLYWTYSFFVFCFSQSAPISGGLPVACHCQGTQNSVICVDVIVCCVLSLLQRGFLSWSQQSCLNSPTARPPTS